MADWEKTLVVILLIIVIVMIMRNERQPKCYPPVKVREGLENHQTSNTGVGLANTEFKERAEILKAPNYGDYNQLIQAIALEPEVFKSQDEYNAGMNRFSSGASMQSERSDPNNLIPRLGIRPVRPEEVDIGDNSRVVPSETPDQLSFSKPTLWKF